MKACEVCKRIALIEEKQNRTFVMELETGYVVFGDFQCFKGYTLFLCKQHINEVFELDKAFRQKHLEEMTVVAKAVSIVFDADKMNYEALGNNISHLHWHLFPRTKGDSPISGPVWWLGKETLYDSKYAITNDFIETYKTKLQDTILSLL